MSALTTFALLAQREAERQRGQAEALVEFMLTDLRDRLKGVGRLDVLTTVNERTLKYYADQQIEALPPASQARYARILLAMGEDDLARGQFDSAARKFATAHVTTGRLISSSPRAPDRVWSHGQSEFWLGFHAYRVGKPKQAGTHWNRYRELSASLAESWPSVAKFRRELAYADGNLCTLALSEPIDASSALKHCAASLSAMRDLYEVSRDRALMGDVVNRHAWMADAYDAAGDWKSERAEWLAAEALLQEQRAADPLNKHLLKVWIVQQRGIAKTDVRLGNFPEAHRRLSAALDKLEELTRLDPDNGDWGKLKSNISSALSYVDREMDRGT
jgi:tetratricopeptide (TPR) repeat protein